MASDLIKHITDASFEADVLQPATSAGSSLTCTPARLASACIPQAR